jgi:hypothetical protein
MPSLGPPSPAGSSPNRQRLLGSYRFEKRGATLVVKTPRLLLAALLP